MNKEKAGPSLCFCMKRSVVLSDVAGLRERELMTSPGSTGSARHAFEVLAQEHLPRLYAFALRLTGERAAAEDLVQETYAKAYQAFHQFVSDRDARPWLTKILLNTFRDQMRRECRVPPSFYPEDLDAWYQTSSPSHRLYTRAIGPEEQVIDRSFADEVTAALADLSPDFRTVVLLADLEGHSYQEIADLVECPLGTVMSRLARGRRILRETLREYARKHGLIEG
jgi:RNA polymerase sigma-70 factor (ECF subfamily)